MIDNSILFFKIWRNIYINSIIFQHVLLYKINKTRSFKNLQELKLYKERDYIGKIIYNGDKELTKCDLPQYGVLKCVQLVGNEELSNINEGSIPNGVERVIFPYSTNIPPKLNNLPPSVTRVYNVNLTYFKNIQTPHTITKMSFGPHTIELSKFSSLFSSNRVYPSNIKSIEFDAQWNNNNKVISKNEIPVGVERLNLGGYTKEIIVGVIPLTVTKLSIFLPFKKDTLRVGSIPTSVAKLIINCPYSGDGETITNPYSISSSLIPSVTSLKLLNNFKNSIVKGNLPKQLKCFQFSCDVEGFTIQHGSLPDTLTNFISGGGSKCDEQMYGWNQPIGIDFFPPALTYLDLGSDFNQILEPLVLPSSIKTLKFGHSYSKQLKLGSIPEGVETLHFSGDFNQDLFQGIIPMSVKELSFYSGTFKQSIHPNILPTSLTTLSLGYSFNSSFEKGCFECTPNLKQLNFHKSSKFDIISILNNLTKDNTLPPSLNVITLPTSLKDKIKFPSTIKLIKYL